MRPISLFLYPELRDMPYAQRRRALRRARREPLDVLELVGIAASLIVAMLVVRYALPDGQVPTWLRFAVLAAIGAVTVGPFMVRRTRRALRVRP